jgi:hypothetical protein
MGQIGVPAVKMGLGRSFGQGTGDDPLRHKAQGALAFEQMMVVQAHPPWKQAAVGGGGDPMPFRITTLQLPRGAGGAGEALRGSRVEGLAQA